MNKFIKILAVWILVFALPVQGFAAATMMNCEQSHSHEAKSVAEGHSHAMHSGHDEGVSHEAAVHEDVADAADAADNHATHHSSSTKHACSHCGTCTVCCTSTAIVGSSLRVPAQFDDRKVNLAYTAAQFTSFISAGIERPPRFILV